MLAANASPNVELSGLTTKDRDLTGFWRVQVAVNAVNGQLLFGLNGVYETTNFGDVVSQIVGGVKFSLPAFTAPVVTALAYGGMNSDGIAAENVIYAARSNVIYVRTNTNAPNFDYSASVSTKIQSIVLDPKNWKVAYAVGGGAVYATVNGGKSWKNITGLLAPFNSNLGAVQLIKANGHDYLLVGGTDGVFVSQDPLGVPNQTNNYQVLPSGSPGILWSALNVGLPHAQVTQISYTPSIMLTTPGGLQNRGDVLLISTLGGGVFKIGNVSDDLGMTNTLTITGPQANANVVIEPDPQDPQYIDVKINGNVLPDNRYPAQSISRIVVANLGPVATLTIDTRLSILGGGISFNGGGDATLRFMSPEPATTQVSKLRGHNWTIVISRPNGALTVSYTNPAGPPQNLPQFPVLTQFSQGLTALFTSSLAQALDDQDIPVLGTTVGDVVNGVENVKANSDPNSGGGGGMPATRIQAAGETAPGSSSGSSKKAQGDSTSRTSAAPPSPTSRLFSKTCSRSATRATREQSATPWTRRPATSVSTSRSTKRSTGPRPWISRRSGAPSRSRAASTSACSSTSIWSSGSIRRGSTSTPPES